MARYIVIRRAPDLPEDFSIGELEGLWLDADEVSSEPPLPNPSWIQVGLPGEAVAVPTGRVERRDDGEHAEVYEVRP